MSANTPKAMRGGIFEVFDYLRFPLIIAVVFIHSGLATSPEIIGKTSYIPYANFVSDAISYIIGGMAVPFFFFISGYLFFRNFETWSWSLYLSKLKKRVRSLLIPYIFWNAIAILGFYIVQIYSPNLLSGNKIHVQDYTIIDFLKAFWMGIDNSGYPSNYPLWFVRNLMVIVCLSPIVWFIIKHHYIRLIVLPILFFCFLILQTDLHCLDTSSAFFFTTGAFLSHYRIDIIQPLSKIKKILLIIYIIFAFITLTLINNPIRFYFRQISVIIGIPTVLCFITNALRNSKIHMPRFLNSSSFFIFAAHGLFIAFVAKSLLYIFHPSSQLALLIYYFGKVILTVFPLLGLYYILKRFFPRFTAIITGGRQS